MKPTPKSGSKSYDITKEVNDFFEENPELKLNDLDSYLMQKLIIQSLSQMINDEDGNSPAFFMSNDTIFMEIDNIRFSIQITNNSLRQ